MKDETVQSLNIPRNVLSEDRVGFCIATRSVKKLSPNNKRQKTSDTLRYLYSRAFITPVLTTSASVTSQLRRLSVKSIKLQIKSALGLLACNALQSPQASAGGGGCSGRPRPAPAAQGSAGPGPEPQPIPALSAPADGADGSRLRPHMLLCQENTQIRDLRQENRGEPAGMGLRGAGAALRWAAVIPGAVRAGLPDLGAEGGGSRWGRRAELRAAGRPPTAPW